MTFASVPMADGRTVRLGSEGRLGCPRYAQQARPHVLDGDRSTQFDPTVAIHVDGHELRRPDGRSLDDGPDGRRFYWQALRGKTLYQLDTASLQDEDR